MEKLDYYTNEELISEIYKRCVAQNIPLFIALESGDDDGRGTGLMLTSCGKYIEVGRLIAESLANDSTLLKAVSTILLGQA